MEYPKLNIKWSYESYVDDLVMDFYIPMLTNAKRYDRIAGFFSSTSLALSARGISGLIENNGKMRLVTCPRLNKHDMDMINQAIENKEELLAKQLILQINTAEITDKFQRDHIAALGWMLSHGYLEMKIAYVLKNGIISDSGEDPIMHQKVGIFYDSEMHAISFSGSNNESASGWLDNVEEFKTFKSWDPSQKNYCDIDRKRFDEFWNNTRKGVEVIDLPEAVKRHLLYISNDFNIESISLGKYYERRHREEFLFHKKQKLELFSYQKEAVQKWVDCDYKLLFEMATGSGKTRTAIGCIENLLKKQIEPILFIISCPQSNLSTQWKNDIDKIDISFSESIICDGTSPNWRSILKKTLVKLSTGLLKSLVIYTTHQTCSNKDFINMIETFAAKINKVFVGDEVHGMGAQKTRLGLLDCYAYRIGLSATPSRWFDEEGSEIISDYFGNNKFEFSIHQAQTMINPVTGKPFLVNYYYRPRFIELSDDELKHYKNLTEQIIRHQPKSKEEKSDLMEKLLFARADIEKNAINKYDELKNILHEIGDEISDTIIFVSDEQISNVMQILKDMHIIAHEFTQKQSASQSSKYGGISEREHLVNLFAAGKYQVLVAIKCLDEGIDIPYASRAIVMASSTNPREYIQRVGRVIRQAKGKKNASIYDMIIHPDTSGFRDEKLEKLEKKIFRKEMDRVKELSENAINNAEVFDIIYKELRKL